MLESITFIKLCTADLKAYITIAIRLRHDYDKKFDVFFSRRIASNGSRRAQYVVVVSQSNRNFDHFRRSRMRRGIVVYEVVLS